MVWSKCPFLQAGFSLTPVTKQCHSWTWSWFNPFEILPIEGFNIGNIQSTNSFLHRMSFETNNILLCSQERVQEYRKMNKEGQRRSSHTERVCTGAANMGNFLLCYLFSASLWSTFPLWDYALLKDTVAPGTDQGVKYTLHSPNKSENWNQWLFTSSLTLIQPIVNYKIWVFHDLN